MLPSMDAVAVAAVVAVAVAIAVALKTAIDWGIATDPSTAHVQGYVEVVRYLVEHGVDKNTADYFH